MENPSMQLQLKFEDITSSDGFMMFPVRSLILPICGKEIVRGITHNIDEVAISGLAEMTTLEELHYVNKVLKISFANSLVDLTLLNLNLVELSLSFCESLIDLQPIESLRSLKKISLSNCSLVENIRPLRHVLEIKLTTLRRLENINALRYENNEIKVKKLSIQDCKLVKDISIFCFIEEVYYFIPLMQNVEFRSSDEELHLAFNSRQSQLKNPSFKNKSMTVVSLGRDSLSKEALRSIASKVRCEFRLVSAGGLELSQHVDLSCLSHLTNVALNKIKGITDVSGLAYVRHLKFFDCEPLTSLNGLGVHNYSIYLEKCNKTEDFSALKRIPVVTIRACSLFSNGIDVNQVQYLSIWDCRNFSDVSMLGDVKQLTITDTYNRISSLHGLSKVPVLVFNAIGASTDFSMLTQNKKIVIREKSLSKITEVSRTALTTWYDVFEDLPFPGRGFTRITCLAKRTAIVEDAKLEPILER